MHIPTPQRYQLAAIALILLAGFLWSSKLGQEALASEMAKIRSSQAEQAELLRSRIEKRTDALELLAMGKSLLSGGQPYFAAVVLERATILAPKVRDGWYLLGYSYLEVAKYGTNPREQALYRNKAIPALKQALELDPQHQPSKDLLNQINP